MSAWREDTGYGEGSSAPAEPLTAADRRSAWMWDDFMRRDPELARIEIGIARCGRILAADHMGSPQYAEAIREDRKLRDERWALWGRRAAAAASEKAA